MEANAHNYRLFSLTWSAPMQISWNKRSFKKENASAPYKIGLRHQLFHCFGTSLLKMTDVASYINALFVTISFIQTGQQVIIITINSKKGHSIN